MKNWKHCTFISIFAILVFVFAFGCSANNNSLSGTWETNSNYLSIVLGRDQLSIQSITFSGKKFTIKGILLIERNASAFTETVQKGTYSISENKIEMVFSNGDTEVFPFSRTENTLTIYGRRYDRKR